MEKLAIEDLRESLLVAPADMYTQLQSNGVLTSLFDDRAHGTLLQSLGGILAWSSRAPMSSVGANLQLVEQAVKLAISGSAGTRTGAIECLRQSIDSGMCFEGI